MTNIYIFIIKRTPSSQVVSVKMPFGITQNAQQITKPVQSYYYYAIPQISDLIPNGGPMSGHTKVKVIGLNMFPLNSVKGLHVQKTSFFKFGKIYTKSILEKKNYDFAFSPPSLIPTKVLVQVKIYIKLFNY